MMMMMLMMMMMMMMMSMIVYIYLFSELHPSWMSLDLFRNMFGGGGESTLMGERVDLRRNIGKHVTETKSVKFQS